MKRPVQRKTESAAAGFTIVETLAGLTMASAMLLMLFLAAAPLERAAANCLSSVSGRDKGLLLLKTLKTDLLFMRRGTDAAGFDCDGRNLAFFAMERPAAEGAKARQTRIAYEARTDGIYRTSRSPRQENPLCERVLGADGARFEYLGDKGWQSEWGRREKTLPRAARAVWPGPEGKRRELTVALP